MKIQLTKVSRFQSWESIKDRFRVLGPKRCLRILVTSALSSQKVTAGVFDGNEIHNYGNHHFAARILFRLLLDGDEESEILYNSEFTDDEFRTLDKILMELNSRIGEYSQKSEKAMPDNPSYSQLRRRLVPTLMDVYYSHRNRNDSIEWVVGRTWRMIDGHLRTPSESTERQLNKLAHVPLSSGFDAIEYDLLLYMVLFVRNGWIENAKKDLGDTILGQNLEVLCSTHASDIENTVGTWDEIIQYPELSIESPFSHAPVFRYGDSLIAPDPGLMFAGFTHRTITKFIEVVRQDDAEVQKAARTAIGHIYESYVLEVLRSCISNKNTEKLVPEFDIEPGIQSPDAFLLDGVTVVFEAKATRLPDCIRRSESPKALSDWLRKITGERTGKRGALRQGQNFFGRWKKGDDSIVSRVGSFPGYNKIIYAIVCFEDVPMFVNGVFFSNRRQLPELFDEGVRRTAARTVLLSTRDLEIFAASLESGGFRKMNYSLSGLLDAYMRHCRETNGVWEIQPDGSRRYLSSFGDFILEKYSITASTELELLSEAFTSASDAAQERLFGEDSESFAEMERKEKAKGERSE